MGEDITTVILAIFLIFGFLTVFHISHPCGLLHCQRLQYPRENKIHTFRSASNVTVCFLWHPFQKFLWKFILNFNSKFTNRQTNVPSYAAKTLTLFLQIICVVVWAVLKLNGKNCSCIAVVFMLSLFVSAWDFCWW